MAQTSSSILNQAVNLAPKAKRGDVQRYVLDIQTVLLDDVGTPKHLKHDWLGYSQLCLANGPDTGITYQVTIDSFSVGQKLTFDMKDMGRANADQFTGKTFSYTVKQSFPVEDGCYGFRIDFPKGQQFSQSYEMQEYFTILSLLEQLRYTSGRRLAKVGDQVSIKPPNPICYSIPQVVVDTETKLSTITLTLEGFSLYRGEPCAIIDITPLFAQTGVKFIQPDTTDYWFRGILSRSGKFQVRLSDGDIVSAVIRDRIDSKMVPDPDAERPRTSKVFRTITLNQLF